MIESIVGKIKYKPGWEILGSPNYAKGCFYVTVQCRTTCVFTGEPLLLRGQSFPLHYEANVDEVLQTVRELIHELEIHESDEYLTYGDEHPFYPH
jgi:hypothetical protein